jgi:hypothetical protein
MSFYIINNFRQLDSSKWAEFVNSHPNGNIFQLPTFAYFYEQTKKHEPLCIFCLDSHGEILGLLQAVIIKQGRGFFSRFTIRSIIAGGPLIKDNDSTILNLILTHYEIEVKSKKVIYTQFRNSFDTTCFRSVFEQFAYSFEDHLDIHFDLRKSTSELWMDVHPTRRKQISRAYKRGVVVKIVASLENDDIAICYDLLNQVYKKAKIPLVPLEFFLKANSILKHDNLLYALAYFENKIIGFRVALLHNNLIYDWYAASNPDHYDKYPNDVLPWEIIQWGCTKNFRIFDFGGAGKPNVAYGVRDYKLKFGGSLYNFGRYVKINKSLLYKLVKLLFQVWQFLHIKLK